MSPLLIRANIFLNTHICSFPASSLNPPKTPHCPHNPVQSLVRQLVFARPPPTPHTLRHQNIGTAAYPSSPPRIPPVHGKHSFLTGSLNLFPKTSLKTQLQHHLLCTSFLIPIHWYPGFTSIVVLVIY